MIDKASFVQGILKAQKQRKKMLICDYATYRSEIESQRHHGTWRARKPKGLKV